MMRAKMPVESKGKSMSGNHGVEQDSSDRIRAGQGTLLLPGGEAETEAGKVKIARLFRSDGVSPYESVRWSRRNAAIRNDRGEVIFEQHGIEVPEFWSELALNVVASKYFYGACGAPEREQSVWQLVHRVARTIADWGIEDGYFASKEDGERFYDELATLLLQQYGAFNSPVWFNVGLYHQYGIEGKGSNWHWDRETRQVVRTVNSYEYPQASACFIQSVEDSMDSIMELARSEAMLFKYGSGTGTDLTPLRSSREWLSGGGRPSGPVSFMRVYDSIAAVVKSGGKTRRAAKMQTLKCWHPDIIEFIECKAKEERKARALVREGYAPSMDDGAYASVFFQNANLSVRVSDEFMAAVENDGQWQTRAVTTGEVIDTFRARELMRKIAEATWLCGDPGLQYEDTIQRWHTCPNSGPINSSNPCSEYMHVDDSACNLASLNLLKFLREDGSFDIARFCHAVRIFIIAQEILVDHASYPTRKITENAHKFRQLGLGYTNLGALLMSLGLPYDAQQARRLAATITALMTGIAYRTSAELAARLGPFEEYLQNREPMLKVIEQHRAALEHSGGDGELLDAARKVWDECLKLGREHGFRNAQVTVLAPTGTISFMMDADTTGIEPDIALVKYKQLAGGGTLKLVNRTVPEALRRLGYNEQAIEAIVKHLEETGNIETAPGLNPEHLAVFDCAFKPPGGSRSIPYMAHIKMMAAVQPFISGAISKTVNMPKETSVDEISDAYMMGWKLGLKALAIYRDGAKEVQPLTTVEKREEERKLVQKELIQMGPRRERLPEARKSLTHKFSINGLEGYITVGFYADGRPGELFINMAKEGSTIGGLMDTIGILTSLALQYGVPLDALVRKFEHVRFEPSGMSRNPDIPFAKSVVDYIFRWLGINFVPGYREANTPQRELISGLEQEGKGRKSTEKGTEPKKAQSEQSFHEWLAHFQADAPPCDLCGAITVRSGLCFKCINCGHSMGCS